jgi:hypothetical protein
MQWDLQKKAMSDVGKLGGRNIQSISCGIFMNDMMLSSEIHARPLSDRPAEDNPTTFVLDLKGTGIR